MMLKGGFFGLNASLEVDIDYRLLCSSAFCLNASLEVVLIAFFSQMRL